MHITRPDDKNHIIIPKRSVITDSKIPYNYARIITPKTTQNYHYNEIKKKGKPTATANTAHRQCLSSPATTTLHKKIQNISKKKI